MATIRVAATQYEIGVDVDANLEKLLRFIEKAAAGGARLVASPEFANHPSFWADKEYCWSVSVPIDGSFVNAVREHARKHQYLRGFQCHAS